MIGKQNTFRFLKAGPYDDGTSDDLYGEMIRYCQAIHQPFLKRTNVCNRHYPIHIQGHHVSIPSESQNIIPHCYLECDTRTTKSNSHVWTHI